MAKINNIVDIQSALVVFEQAAIKQANATEEGDYKEGNKYYDEIIKAIAFIKNENAISKLKSLLSHSSVGVRMWSACFLLSTFEQEAEKVLTDISCGDGIHSLTAETTLQEWKNGELRF